MSAPAGRPDPVTILADDITRVVEQTTAVSRADIQSVVELVETQSYTSLRDAAAELDISSDIPEDVRPVADCIPYWYPYFRRLSGELGVDLSAGEVLVAELLYDTAAHTNGLDGVVADVLLEYQSIGGAEFSRL